ncbi:hypothetical protein [Spirosoma spitsbergense]|nr:hypothetical protein [Spirosoma spitsbergense]
MIRCAGGRAAGAGLAREVLQKLAFLTGPPERCDSPTTQSGV